MYRFIISKQNYINFFFSVDEKNPRNSEFLLAIQVQKQYCCLKQQLVWSPHFPYRVYKLLRWEIKHFQAYHFFPKSCHFLGDVQKDYQRDLGYVNIPPCIPMRSGPSKAVQ